MPEEQLQSLYREECRKDQEERLAAAEAKEQALFINTQAANADIDHWSRAAHWSLDEAVALSFGKDPGKVNSASIKNYTDISKFAKRYVQRLDLARRAVPWGKLFDPVLPGLFIAWARNNEIPFPAELEALVKARGNFVGNWKTNFDALLEKHNALAAELERTTKALSIAVQERDDALARLDEIAANPTEEIEPDCKPREKDSLLKLVIGLAIGGYSYDPKLARSRVASEIAGDLRVAGVPLDDDTIRKWLRAGAELLPRDIAD